MPALRPPVVVLDACVLYPAAQRDLFMWLAATGAIRAHWTDEIHEEWMRNVAQDLGIERPVLERVRRLMDKAADDALIRGYRRHEHRFPLTDAKDRHVAAAAFRAGQRAAVDHVTILTWNIKDFDRAELSAAGLSAVTPDDFLTDLMRESPEAVRTAFDRMRENLRKPEKTFDECVDALAAQGLKRFSEALKGPVT
ncbi:MAG: PIN domain-containing protein [Azonexus sp.]|nr:PIN domain-containing protein [Azonexus sp.]